MSLIEVNIPNVEYAQRLYTFLEYSEMIVLIF